MVPFDRRAAISIFNDWLNVPQPYSTHYGDLASQRVEELQERYFPKITELTDKQVMDLLRKMRANIVENSYPARIQGDHGLLEDWKRCCHGIARYLLLPGMTDEIDSVLTAEVCIRLSGYCHHGACLFQAFRGTARAIANEIWTQHGIDLPYIPIPQAWQETIPHDAANEEGDLELWAFAGYQRKLASRILCYLCDGNYQDIYIGTDDKAAILAEYREARQRRIDANILSRWSVASGYVNRLTQAMIVNATRLEAHLDASGFDQNMMSNPDLPTREMWFRRMRAV